MPPVNPADGIENVVVHSGKEPRPPIRKRRKHPRKPTLGDLPVTRTIVDLITYETTHHPPLTEKSFLRLEKRTMRSRYDDGTTSRPYTVDAIHRPRYDSAGVVLYHIERPAEGPKRLMVAVKRGLRPILYLRRELDLPIPDEREYLFCREIVSGSLEEEDRGPEGLKRRMAEEAREEAGFAADPAEVEILGGGFFPSHGQSSEKIFMTCLAVDPAEAGPILGDGGSMEEGGEVVFRPLGEVLQDCRRGEIEDPKLEIGLSRLAGRLGYLPELDAWIEELPEEWRARYRPLL